MQVTARRLRVAAAAVTLLSGAVMTFAGYVGQTDSWRTAGFITIPGGVLILSALTLARWADGSEGGVLALGGAPRAGGVRVMTLTLISGAVMVLAGYAGAASGWALTPLLATMGGLVIGGAFALDRRDTHGRRRRK
jgi:hypothetical protein